jgi:NitT/TauT family transport system ATP-binding protein
MTERSVHVFVDHARKSFRKGDIETPVLDDISLEIYRGEFLTLFGPNGCGKTTLLNVIAGVEPLDSGSVVVNSRADGQKTKVGFIFQDYRGNLMPWLTVAQNIAFPLQVLGVPKRERLARAEELLSRFGFRLDLSARTYTLSGGQAQLTSILRALIIDPEILIMDEPFSALDYQTNLALYEKVLLIWKTAGMTVVLISHDIEEALYLGERTVFLKRRPARIAAILENDVPGPKDLGQIGTEAFSALKRRALEIFRKEAAEIE